jgi:hypothetical protein
LIKADCFAGLAASLTADELARLDQAGAAS